MISRGVFPLQLVLITLAHDLGDHAACMGPYIKTPTPLRKLARRLLALQSYIRCTTYQSNLPGFSPEPYSPELRLTPFSKTISDVRLTVKRHTFGVVGSF